MALQSSLFRGVPQLEAAALSDAAHIFQGAKGDHVRKLQIALNKLNRAGLTEDGVFGSGMAAAVLAYKKARAIINFGYQTQPDNIVGKMTMAALDRELCLIPDPIVIIGRPSVSVPPLALTRSPQAPTAPSVSAVIRGNPQVAKNAVEVTGLPSSVPPSKSYEVTITVVPPLSGSDTVDIEVIHSGGLNGAATVAPQQLQASGVVTITGSRQTSPGSAGKLQIQASLNGKVLATSNGFSVCAHPRTIQISKGLDVDELGGVGMIVKDTIESDSGSSAELDQVEWSELVDPITRDEPPFGRGSGFVNNSGYLQAIPPAGTSITDRHVEPRPSAGPKGQTVKVQVHMFKCKRCGAVDIPIPFSGFEIVHEVLLVGKEFKHRVTKRPLDTGVRIETTKKIIKAKAGSGTVVSAFHTPGPKP